MGLVSRRWLWFRSSRPTPLAPPPRASPQAIQCTPTNSRRRDLVDFEHGQRLVPKEVPMRSLLRWNLVRRVLPLVGVLAASPAVVEAQFWPQWALNPQHTGSVGVVGQPLNSILTSV